MQTNQSAHADSCPQSKTTEEGAWSDEVHILFIRCIEDQLPGKKMATRCTLSVQQAERDSVVLWEIFCWETLINPD